MSVFLSSNYYLKTSSILLPNMVIVDRNFVAKVLCGPQQFGGLTVLLRYDSYTIRFILIKSISLVSAFLPYLLFVSVTYRSCENCCSLRQRPDLKHLCVSLSGA